MAKKKKQKTQGEMIRSLIYQREMTITAACKEMDVSRESIRAVFNGKPVGYRVASKVEAWANKKEVSLFKMMGE